METSRGGRSVADSRPNRRASSSWCGDGKRFKLAVQFFPQLVGAVEVPFGLRILHPKALEPLSLSVDSGDGDRVAQVVEAPFQPADIPFRGRKLLLKPGLTHLSGSPHRRSLDGSFRHRTGR